MLQKQILQSGRLTAEALHSRGSKRPHHGIERRGIDRETHAVAFLLDRASKALVQHYLPLDAPQPLLGHLVYLTHTQNTGAAFSLGLSFGSFFLLLAAAVSLAIVVYNRRLPSDEVLLRVGLGMILGGALGNALDRAVVGSVTDFIDLRWWPVFNVADSCIVVGAVISSARLSVRDRRRPA